jgi:hypothetical protein
MRRTELTVMPPRMQLPKDASISYDAHPARLFVCMTITKVEHIHALYDLLEHYTPLLEDDR